jgi:hydroxymethylbilane synthase
LAALGGGCSVPIAAHAELKADQIDLSALVASLDGSTIIRASASGPRSQAAQIGAEAARKLIEQNADALLTTL